MAEFWIVTSHDYEHHATVDGAVGEMRRLQTHLPDKKFRVLRCKKSIRPARHFTKLVTLLKDIVRDGLTKANKERAQVLISTIETRGRA